MIVVTSTAKRAGAAAARCVLSVREQSFPEPFFHFYTAADPETAEVVRAAVDASPGVPCSTFVYEHGCPSLENLLRMWRSLKPHDVVVWLDGDDELTPGAIEHVRRMHHWPGVWLTYGSFVRSDGLLDYLWAHQFGRRYVSPPRFATWRATHLRTFRAGLVQALDESHFRSLTTGAFYEFSTDVVVMVPLLELAGERYTVSTDVLCRYNFDGAAHARRKREELDVVSELRAREPLAPLEQRPW